jgi:hypothetical protein
MTDKFCSLLIELNYLYNKLGGRQHSKSTGSQLPHTFFFFFFKVVDEMVVASLVKLLPPKMLLSTLAFSSKTLERASSLCG